jgi:hypothetical protein
MFHRRASEGARSVRIVRGTALAVSPRRCGAGNPVGIAGLVWPAPVQREGARITMARRNSGFLFLFLWLLGSAAPLARAQQAERQQMRGLDEQVQEIKSDVLGISQELTRLEEKLLYPSGTQVAVFVALAKGDTLRLDAVRLQIDGQLVAHYIYGFKELDALRKGGVQRLYVGNVATGEHQLEVLLDGKLADGADFSRTEHFTFRKEVKPKLVGLTVAGPDSGTAAVTLGEW